MNVFTVLFPGVVPHSGHDGARLRDDWRDLSLLHGLCGGSLSGDQDRGHLQTVL